MLSAADLDLGIGQPMLRPESPIDVKDRNIAPVPGPQMYVE